VKVFEIRLRRDAFCELIMEVMIWAAIVIGTAVVVWALAPYHQRIIDHRETVTPPETWD